MADVMDDIFSGEDKGQTVKSNEITGDRFPFHSLPKEFQDWHNVYYILEKQSPLDRNAVSKAIYNGYMWKTIMDGSAYGIAMVTTIIAFSIKVKIEFTLLWFLISLLISAISLSWIAYHFIFYAMIRSQVVGEVTKQSAGCTTYTFYNTFFGVTTSVIIAFIFGVYIFHSMLPLFYELIVNLYYKYPETIGFMQNVKEVLVFIHNVISRMISTDGNIFNNIYVIIIAATAFSYGVIFLTERFVYTRRKEEIEFEVEKTKQEQGYAIETAQRLMKKWRAERA